MTKNPAADKYAKMYGFMALLLGFGDAFHLLPRIYALWNGGLAAHHQMLGFGKFVTSITMTGFYLLFYGWFGAQAAKKPAPFLDNTMYILGALRVALCLLPQNRWLSADPPLLWGVARNIPFTAMGLLLIGLLWKDSEMKMKRDDASSVSAQDSRLLALCIFLSFLFYLPVVLWADQHPLVGMLMIPKTLAYVAIVWLGWRRMDKKQLSAKTLA